MRRAGLIRLPQGRSIFTPYKDASPTHDQQHSNSPATQEFSPAADVPTTTTTNKKTRGGFLNIDLRGIISQNGHKKCEDNNVVSYASSSHHDSRGEMNLNKLVQLLSLSDNTKRDSYLEILFKCADGWRKEVVSHIASADPSSDSLTDSSQTVLSCLDSALRAQYKSLASLLYSLQWTQDGVSVVDGLSECLHHIGYLHYIKWFIVAISHHLRATEKDSPSNNTISPSFINNDLQRAYELWVLSSMLNPSYSVKSFETTQHAYDMQIISGELQDQQTIDPTHLERLLSAVSLTPSINVSILSGSSSTFSAMKFNFFDRLDCRWKENEGQENYSGETPLAEAWFRLTRYFYNERRNEECECVGSFLYHFHRMHTTGKDNVPSNPDQASSIRRFTVRFLSTCYRMFERVDLDSIVENFRETEESFEECILHNCIPIETAVFATNIPIMIACLHLDSSSSKDSALDNAASRGCLLLAVRLTRLMTRSLSASLFGAVAHIVGWMFVNRFFSVCAVGQCRIRPSRELWIGPQHVWKYLRQPPKLQHLTEVLRETLIDELHLLKRDVCVWYFRVIFDAPGFLKEGSAFDFCEAVTYRIPEDYVWYRPNNSISGFDTLPTVGVLQFPLVPVNSTVSKFKLGLPFQEDFYEGRAAFQLRDSSICLGSSKSNNTLGNHPSSTCQGYEFLLKNGFTCFPALTEEGISEDFYLHCIRFLRLYMGIMCLPEFGIIREDIELLLQTLTENTPHRIGNLPSQNSRLSWDALQEIVRYAESSDNTWIAHSDALSEKPENAPDIPLTTTTEPSKEKGIKALLVGVKVKRSPITNSDPFKPEEPQQCLIEREFKAPILLDGSNIAMRHSFCTGKGRMFSTRGILLALEYYVSLGHSVLVFFPEELINETEICQKKYASTIGFSFSPAKFPDEVAVLKRLVSSNQAILTPPGDYDDSYMIRYALMHDGCIVSNDRFRDFTLKQATSKESNRYDIAKKWLRAHLITFTFVRDEFLPNPDFVLPKQSWKKKVSPLIRNGL